MEPVVGSTEEEEEEPCTWPWTIGLSPTAGPRAAEDEEEVIDVLPLLRTVGGAEEIAEEEEAGNCSLFPFTMYRLELVPNVFLGEE